MARLPGTKAGASYAIPECSKGHGKMQRNDVGEWFCLTCADDFLKTHVDRKLRGKSVGGVDLPVGVADPRRVTPSFRDLMLNRRHRRALRKG